MIYPLAESFCITAIMSVYDFSWDCSFRFMGERHSQWETVCVISGQVEISEDEKIYILSAGDYICHGSMEFHQIRSTGGTSPRVLVMSFDHAGTLPSVLMDGIFHLSPQQMERYQALFADIHTYCHTAFPDPLCGTGIRFALGSFLLQLSQQQPDSSGRRHSPAAEAYQQLIDAMQKTLDENISLPELSLRTGIGISTMKTLFRNYAGIGPKAYYAHMRLLEARRRLEAGQNLQSIAEQMNFSSPNYLSACYKKQFGISPGRWRRQAIGNNEPKK